MSNNLDLDQLTTGQTDKETTVNTATGQIDAAITETLTCDLTSGDVTLTATQFRRNQIFQASNVATSGRKINLPSTSIKRSFLVFNPASSTNSIAVVKGSTSINVGIGEIGIFYADGTTNGLLGGSLVAVTGTVAEAYSIGTSCVGKPATSEKLIVFAFPYSATLAASASGSQCVAQTAATAQTDFTLKKNGSSIGTIRFAAAGTVASYVSISSTTFAAGDVLTIEAPASQDATLADIGFSLKLTRTSN